MVRMYGSLTADEYVYIYMNMPMKIQSVQPDLLISSPFLFDLIEKSVSNILVYHVAGEYFFVNTDVHC